MVAHRSRSRPTRTPAQRPVGSAAVPEPPRVLWVSEEAPDRTLSGGNIRQAHLLTALARRTPTSLLLAGRLADEVTRDALESVTEVPTSSRPPASKLRQRAEALIMAAGAGSQEVYGARSTRRAIGAKLRAIADDADIVIINHQALAPLLRLRRRGRWVAEIQHVSAEMARQERVTIVGGRQRWVNSREITQAARLERWICDSFDLVSVVCEEDRALLGLDAARALLTPNGVDIARYVATPLPSAPRVVFPAALNFLPNVEGALWFCREVWPRIRAGVPEAELSIVGRSPVPQVVELGNLPGVAVHGDVESMVPWLAWGRVVVVPLHIGTGTRLKAVEAMGSGRPVVGTAIGLGGLGLVNGEHAAISDDPAVMATDIITLLGDDQRAAAMAEAGRNLAVTKFDWTAIAERFATDLLAAAGGAAGAAAGAR